ncbi:MAG TPA: DNA polymerase III subunit delta [Candidatus Binatia bacterium]
MSATLHVLAEERRGEFDALRADRALADIRRGLEREGGTVAVLSYHGADCDPYAVADAIETPSLFGGRTLVVVRGAEALPERAHERLVQALERQAPQVTVAIVARGADQRRRLFARVRDLGHKVPVDHPRLGEMAEWADRFAREHGHRISEEARGVLLDCVGRDLLVLASEMDKLAAAVPAERTIEAGDVLRVSAPGREHGTFEMTDAVLARDHARAVRLLAHALDEGAQPIALIGALAATLRPILAGAELMAQGRRLEDAERAVGVNPYQRRTFQQGVRAYGARELRRAMTRLADIDLAIKTGTGDGRALLEDWVLRVCARRVSHANRASRANAGERA